MYISTVRVPDIRPGVHGETRASTQRLLVEGPAARAISALLAGRCDGHSLGLPERRVGALSTAREERARAVTARYALEPGVVDRSVARWRGAMRKRRAKGESATRRGGPEGASRIPRARAPSPTSMRHALRATSTRSHAPIHIDVRIFLWRRRCASDERRARARPDAEGQKSFAHPRARDHHVVGRAERDQCPLGHLASARLLPVKK